MNARSTGKIVVVSAVLPSNACTWSEKPRTSVNNPTVILGLQPAFLGEPTFAEPVALVGLEVQRVGVGPGRGDSVTTVPFPRAARRTRRAPFNATGSPRG
jgi:hypothetical protein